jgi:putative ATP-dependent endonuclease of OLD family
LVEGDSEEYALPIYARSLGYDFDAEGISIVNAHGKLSLDSFYQLYTMFGIPTYPMFDNDRGNNKKERDHNKVLLGMLGEGEELEPDGIVESNFAIIEGNYELATKTDLDARSPGKYDRIIGEANEALGGNAGKGLKARFMAQKLVEEKIVPSFIQEIVEAAIVLDKPTFLGTASEDDYFEFSNGWSDDDEIPF